MSSPRAKVLYGNMAQNKQAALQQQAEELSSNSFEDMSFYYKQFDTYNAQTRDQLSPRTHTVKVLNTKYVATDAPSHHGAAQSRKLYSNYIKNLFEK